jgi:pimeloyl-ACP methyl ester carboxylesterase
MSHISTASGRRIFYDESGTGPPILLIPGQGGYRRGCLVWLAEALAHHFRVVAMDNRDAGESEPETAYYGLADMAGDAVALLDALGIDRTHVLGHSMGAAIALQLALDHPTRDDRLVLASPGVGGEPGHRAGEPLPPPGEWWLDDPVERMRLWLPDILGPDYWARMAEADEAAIVELERGGPDHLGGDDAPGSRDGRRRAPQPARRGPHADPGAPWGRRRARSPQ